MPNRAPIKSPPLTVLTAEPGLSLAAKGLAAYVLSRPPRPITRRELFTANRDGMPFIDAAIRELEAARLIVRVPTRDRDGLKERGGIQLVQP